LDYTLDFEVEAATDHYVTISYVTNSDLPRCARGHELARAQFKLPVRTGEHVIMPEGALTVVDETPFALTVKGHATELTFDKINGQMTAWKKDGAEMVEYGPQLQFWRAPIDNDMYLLDDYKEKYFMHLWHEMVDSVTWEQTDHTIRVTVRSVNGTTNAAWYYACTYEYVIYPNGDILFDV